MPNWDYEVKLADIWEMDQWETFESHRNAIVSRLMQSDWVKSNAHPNLKHVIGELAHTESYQEFNWVWDEVYDYADDTRCWLATF
jgi:hypothetical protein